MAAMHLAETMAEKGGMVAETKTCHAQLLLARLPSFVQSIADYKWDEASVAILPDVNRERTREELKDPWIAVVSPLLLFVHCEKLLGTWQLGGIEEKLFMVGVDLVKVKGGFIGEHEENLAHARMTDTRLETRSQQVSCRSVNCGGMAALTAVLDFLSQLVIVVEIRRSLLGAWKRLFQPTSRDKDVSVAKQVEAARRGTAKLTHHSVRPLARYLEREMEVARLAAEVAEFPETGTALPGFEQVMELRNAILAWERGHLGREEFVLCRLVKEHLIGLVRKDVADGRHAAAGEYEATRTSERSSTHLGLTSAGGGAFTAPPVLALSHESGDRGLSELDGSTAGFIFSLGVPEG